jgi:hypothetical protein
LEDDRPRLELSVLLRTTLSFAGVLLLLAGCDRWSLLISSDGVLSLTIVSDGHSSGGFRVRIRDADGSTRNLELPPAGNLTVDGLAAGELQLTLLPPIGCRVAAPNPRTVMAKTEETVSVAFEVYCRESVESLTGLKTRS